MNERQVGNYRIVEKLGEGGMGVVYKAIDTTLDRVVAMKALSADVAHNPELEQRFRAEAKAQANLHHMSLATLYAFLVEDGTAWMVMEFVDGETFDDMIRRRGPIPSQEALPLFRQALFGIGYAHRNGIVHRDIKPSNLMLNRDGIVKVMDFGIAKVMGNRGMTRTGTQMGTAHYMSPEQVLNKGVDIRSDVYSLGVTLYEMLSANVPFQSDSDYQIMTAHVNTPPPLPTRFYPYIPKGVENAVLKALEKNPDARFQTVEEFGAALENPEHFGVGAAAAAAVPAGVAGGAVFSASARTRNPAAAAPVVAATSTGVEVPPQPQAPVPARAAALVATPQRKAIAGGALALLLLGGGLMLRPKQPPPVSIAHTSSAGVTVPSSQQQEITIAAPPPIAGSENASATGAPANPSAGTVNKTAEKPAEKSSEKQETARPAGPLLPAGTAITVRTIDDIDSSRAQAGQRFEASVDVPVVAGGRTIVQRGASARVRLQIVKNAGHFAGRPELVVQLASINIGGKSYAVTSSPFLVQGSSRGKRSAAVIGGAAAVGGVIGGIFHKGKGALEGAAIGAGGGTAAQALTKPEPIRIPSETLMHFTLRAPVRAGAN